MTDDRDLSDRVRTALSGFAVREVKMFGGLAFMVNEKLAFSVGGQGDLLVRCDPERVEDLLVQPGATWAEMRGKPMGKGWLRIAADGFDNTGDGSDRLAFWIDEALRHNRAATGEAGR